MDDAEIRRHLSGARIRWSQHALMEADADRLHSADVEAAAARDGEAIEARPEDPRGASCLVLCHLPDGLPVHLVVGHGEVPWVVVTVYRPAPESWSADYRRRR